MFIIRPIKAEEATGELKLIYKKIQKTLGFVPPHFELFATIDAKSLMDFIEYNLYFKNHPNINKEILGDICSNISKLPFNEKQKLLLSKVIDAIYNADKFSRDDLEELYSVGFSDKDFYELLGYGTNFMAKSKMIEVYLK